MKNKNPKVSICIPTYNNVDEVKHLLSSICEQDFKDWEIIITDDSTNSEIEELIEECRKDIHRLHYYHNEKPLGHIFNWNRALELAEGEYIKIMFSDDWFTYHDSLKRMVTLLDESPLASMAFCGTMEVSKKKQWSRAATPEYVAKLAEDWRNLFLGNQIGAPSATIYRTCGVMFDERSNWASDMFLYFEILQKNPKFVFSAEPLISIGIHEEQYTGTFTERDIRKFGDSLLMYQKYDLQKSESCRKEMLKTIVKYGQGWNLAKECGNSRKEYRVACLNWFWKNTVMGYWNGFLHKIGLNRQ